MGDYRSLIFDGEDTDVLELNDGDVLILRLPSDSAIDPDRIQRDAVRVKELIDKDVTILVMQRGIGIEMLDEDQMRLLGWVRPERRKAGKR